MEAIRALAQPLKRSTTEPVPESEEEEPGSIPRHDGDPNVVKRTDLAGTNVETLVTGLGDPLG